MFKKTFLLLGAMTFATSAMAVESTNPFFVPAKNAWQSTTSYEFSTITERESDGMRAKEYTHTARQTLEYGLSDSWSIGATISNDWTKETALSETEKSDKSIDFEITSKYNIMSDGKIKVQSLLAYGQEEDNADWGAYKYAKVGAKVGYKAGFWTPYLAGEVEVPLFQSKSRDDNELKYEATAGLYTYCPKMKVSLDNALKVNYDEHDESRIYSYNIEAAYHFTKSVALSAYGKYIIDGEEHKTDIHGNQIGLRLRIGF